MRMLGKTVLRAMVKMLMIVTQGNTLVAQKSQQQKAAQQSVLAKIVLQA